MDVSGINVQPSQQLKRWNIINSTCEGLKSVHFKCLFANFGQIHFQLWADVILLQVFADLKYFVCNALWSRS